MKMKTYLKIFVNLGVIVMATCILVNAQSSKTQSLINEIKAEFPERQKMIAEKCDNASVEIDVDFASFGDNSDALLRVSQLGLKETANGFRRFCTDSNDTTKFDSAKVNALKAKVKKITLKHVSDAAQKKISLLPSKTVLIEMKFDDPLRGGINYVEMARKLGEIL